MNQLVFWLGIEEKELWLEWLNKLSPPLNDIYAHPEYINLHANQERTPICFVFSRDEKIFLYPFLQQKTPFIDGYYDITTPYGYGGPLFNNKDTEFLAGAYSCFYEHAKQRKVVAELIKFNPFFNNHADLEKVFPGVIIPVCNTVFIEVNQDEELRWSQEYTAANRKSINKAKRNDLSVQFAQDEQSWKQFNRLYSETMKFNNAEEFYFFSSQYFQNIRDNLDHNYTLSSAIVGDKVGASMLIPHSQNYAYCHLIGTDKTYQKIGINNYLHHQCIQWCKKRGIRKLLIGGGRSNSNEDSLLKFKKSFSKQLKPFYIGEHVLNKGIYRQLCKLCNKNMSRPINNNILFKYRV